MIKKLFPTLILVGFLVMFSSQTTQAMQAMIPKSVKVAAAAALVTLTSLLAISPVDAAQEQTCKEKRLELEFRTLSLCNVGGGDCRVYQLFLQGFYQGGKCPSQDDHDAAIASIDIELIWLSKDHASFEERFIIPLKVLAYLGEGGVIYVNSYVAILYAAFEAKYRMEYPDRQVPSFGTLIGRAFPKSVNATEGFEPATSPE